MRQISSRSRTKFSRSRQICRKSVRSANLPSLQPPARLKAGNLNFPLTWKTLSSSKPSNEIHKKRKNLTGSREKCKKLGKSKNEDCKNTKNWKIRLSRLKIHNRHKSKTNNNRSFAQYLKRIIISIMRRSYSSIKWHLIRIQSLRSLC